MSTFIVLELSITIKKKLPNIVICISNTTASNKKTSNIEKKQSTFQEPHALCNDEANYPSIRTSILETEATFSWPTPKGQGTKQAREKPLCSRYGPPNKGTKYISATALRPAKS